MTDKKRPWLEIALAPILIWQGRQVKTHTPRLPEAAGPRSGVHGSGRHPLSLLILGDSAAAGVGVDTQSNGLAGQILTALGPDLTVSWDLIAQSGLTTAGMLDKLLALPPQPFDAVVTSLGVNDVKAGIAPDLWLEQTRALIELLRTKFGVRHLVISQVPPMEKFPALPWPLSLCLGRRAAGLNRRLAAWAASCPDISCLAFDLPFDPALMAGDGFHPGPDLHRIWAGQVVASIGAAGLVPPWFPGSKPFLDKSKASL